MAGQTIDNIHKIKTISFRLRLICNIIFYLTPVVILAYWMNYNNWPEYLKYVNVDNFTLCKILPLHTELICALIAMIPGGIIMLATKYLTGLFSLYENKIFFSAENINYIKKLGKLVIIWSFTDIFMNTLMILAISMNNPPGQRLLSIGVGTFQFSTLFIGSAIILISLVMDEARLINDEQQYTI